MQNDSPHIHSFLFLFFSDPTNRPRIRQRRVFETETEAELFLAQLLNKDCRDRTDAILGQNSPVIQLSGQYKSHSVLICHSWSNNITLAFIGRRSLSTCGQTTLNRSEVIL